MNCDHAPSALRVALDRSTAFDIFLITKGKHKDLKLLWCRRPLFLFGFLPICLIIVFVLTLAIYLKLRYGLPSCRFVGRGNLLFMRTSWLGGI